MSTPWATILMFLAASFLGAVGQFLYKAGADRATGGVVAYLVEPMLLGGVACYVAVMVLFVAAFKRGGSPAVLYPVYATTFVWSSLIGAHWFGESIRPVNVAGMLMLLVGIALMGVKS